MFSCNFPEMKQKPTAPTIEECYVGVTITIDTIHNTYYLKQIGGDSLFVHVVRGKPYLNGSWSIIDHIFFTKGTVKSVEWEERRGKFGTIKKTVIQQ